MSTQGHVVNVTAPKPPELPEAIIAYFRDGRWYFSNPSATKLEGIDERKRRLEEEGCHTALISLRHEPAKVPDARIEAARQAVIDAACDIPPSLPEELRAKSAPYSAGVIERLLGELETLSAAEKEQP